MHVKAASRSAGVRGDYPEKGRKQSKHQDLDGCFERKEVA
jgi:hypothetical protein